MLLYYYIYVNDNMYTNSSILWLFFTYYITTNVTNIIYIHIYVKFEGNYLHLSNTHYTFLINTLNKQLRCTMLNYYIHIL